MDGERVTAPDVPPTLECDAEEELPRKQPLSPRSELVPPPCHNSEPAELPPPPPPPAESTCCSLESAVNEVVLVAAESTPALEAMEGERDTTAGVRMALEMAGVELPKQLQRSPCSELAPPRCQNSEPAELPQLSPPPAESTYCSLESAVNEIAVMASEEAAESPPALDAMDREAALESRSKGPLQEHMNTSSSPKKEDEPSSPDMAPPGFENFKSKWLPIPAPSTQYRVEVPVTDTKCVMAEATSGSMPALETMGMEKGIPPGQVPLSKGAEDEPLHQPLLVASSLTIEAAPCSPDTPPPGFENFNPLWIPQPGGSPSAKTRYSPDVATTNEELVENACLEPATDTKDMETDTAHNLLPTLKSGAGDPLQGPEPSSPPPKMQAAPGSPRIMPPGSESLALPQLQLPSPIAQTPHILQDSVATGTVCLTSEDAPQPSPVLREMNVGMDAAPALPTSLENGAHESIQQELSHVPSCTEQGTTCSLEMVSSDSENLEALADAVITTVRVEAVGHPLSVPEATEEAKGHIPPPPLENGSDGPLRCLEPKSCSPVVQVAPSSPEITYMGSENLESCQQTSPLAESINSPSNLSLTKSVTVKSEEMAQLPPALQTTDTDMKHAPPLQSPLKSTENSLPNPQQQPSSPSAKDGPCSLEIAPPGYENVDSSVELPPPPPLCPNFEMGQMVCGCCRELIAYPKGAIHVQCFGCWTINLVLEEHQVGKVYCGQCATFLMYPFGAPAVRCSNCLFVTEIGEHNVRPQMSVEQGTPPRPQELGQT